MTVHRASDRPTDRPSAPQAYQCKITQSTGLVTQMQLAVILAGNRIATRVLVKQRQLKSLKDENGKRKLFLYPWCLKYKLRSIVMSTNLEYRARERQRKRESGRQASEAQREKGQQGFRAKDKKQRRHFFFVGRTT